MWHRWPSRWESAGNSAERFYIILSPRLRDDIEGPPNIDKKSLHFLCTCACQDSMMTPCNERFYTGFTKSLVTLGVLCFNWYKHVLKQFHICLLFDTVGAWKTTLCLSIYMSDIWQYWRYWDQILWWKRSNKLRNKAKIRRYQLRNLQRATHATWVCLPRP
jgi:hypothetical protein